MRETVDKILHSEASRLFLKSQDKGLETKDLLHLDQLINIFKNFVGESAPAEEDLPPEEQSTATLLSGISSGPPIVESVPKTEAATTEVL